MIDNRLEQYFDLLKYFLDNVTDVLGCIQEFRKTQKYISELIGLKTEFELKKKELRRDFEKALAIQRNMQYEKLYKRGVKTTESVIDNVTLAQLPPEICKIKVLLDIMETNFETAYSLMMAMNQRKDIIKETILYFKHENDHSLCLLNSRQFLNRMGIKCDEHNAGVLSESLD